MRVFESMADKWVLETSRQKVCIPSEDEQKSTKDIFYWIEKYMQNEKHPNILFPKYNLE